jgi:hypothetical protein
LPRRPRLTALAFFLLALPMLGVAALATGTLLTTSVGRDPFDPHTYLRLCPVITGGACIAFSGREMLVIGAVAFVLGMALVIAGVRRSRSTGSGSA